VHLLDRVGNIQKAEEYWSDKKKISLLQIRQQNWDQPSLVPQFTSAGFEVRSVPPLLYDFLIDMLELDKITTEPCAPSAHINCRNGEEPPKVEIVGMRDSKKVKRVLGEELKKVAEEWAGLQLELSAVYGVRRYRRGAKLALHVDKLSTHVVSFIINLGQEVDKDLPWNLDILSNSGEAAKVELKPGDMLLYESARLPHGRTQTFQGDSYMNIFVHFRPSFGWYDWDWSPE
jgi:prolyl 4-hydroxylase